MAVPGQVINHSTPDPEGKGGPWQVGLFECFAAPGGIPRCCYVTFCFACARGELADKSGGLFCLDCCMPFPFNICLWSLTRDRLRNGKRIEDGSNCFMDCVSVMLCCAPCATCQEFNERARRYKVAKVAMRPPQQMSMGGAPPPQGYPMQQHPGYPPQQQTGYGPQPHVYFSQPGQPQGYPPQPQGYPPQPPGYPPQPQGYSPHLPPPGFTASPGAPPSGPHASYEATPSAPPDISDVDAEKAKSAAAYGYPAAPSN